ncbi:MAG: hypothetical protein QOC70_2500 [Verrucomicrobiota bacterium]|jgi:murein DD-endopeptidase MepM/ murein hydrolase activator NlpD
MLRTLSTALFCSLLLLAQIQAQDVFVPRELKAIPVTQSEKQAPPSMPKVLPVEPAGAKQLVTAQTAKTAPVKPDKIRSAKAEPVKAPAVKEPGAVPKPERVQSARAEPAKGPAIKDAPANLRPEKVQSVKAEPVKERAKAPTISEPPAKPALEKLQSAKVEPIKVPAVKDSPTNLHPEKVQSAKAEPAKVPAVKESPANSHPEKAQSAKAEPAKVPGAKEPLANPKPEKVQTVKAEPAKGPTVETPAVNPHPEKVRSVKVEPVKAPKEPAANPHPEKVQTVKAEPVKAPVAKEPANPHSEKVQSVKAESVKTPAVKESSTNLPAEKIQSVKVESAKAPSSQEPTVNVQLLNRSMETASTRLADGFDFPVGKPEAEGYYKARGYRVGGHMGEDWDGVRGGDTDFKDPIYCIGDGIVVFARDVHLGWGNVVIVRHAYRESGTVKHIDSLYGHLNSILVRRGQKIARGQQIGTMGTAHGQYDAHLHLEIRKNLEIGMSRSKFQKNLSNYYDPSQFIASHRKLSGGGANFRVAMNTFTHDSAYHFDDSRDFSTRKRSTAESAAALKRAISSTNH